MTRSLFMKWLGRLTVMPLLVIVAALSFGVRFGEFVQGVPPVASATAVETTDMQDIPPLPDLSQLANKPADAEPAMLENPVVDGALPSLPELTEDADPIDWRDAEDTEFEYSEVRMELFQDLSKRRKDLENKDRELAVREALLKAAEQEINQKYKELVSLRSEIQDLLKEQSEEEKKRISSLVKIYEGMKPKDAARIFNTLDLDVLLQVVSQMSERKSAPIIASMNPDRARTLTMMLMEQKSLIDLSSNLMQQ